MGLCQPLSHSFYPIFILYLILPIMSVWSLSRGSLLRLAINTKIRIPYLPCIDLLHIHSNGHTSSRLFSSKRDKNRDYKGKAKFDDKSSPRARGKGKKSKAVATGESDANDDDANAKDSSNMRGLVIERHGDKLLVEPIAGGASVLCSQRSSMVDERVVCTLKICNFNDMNDIYDI